MKTAQISIETAMELYKQGGAAKAFALDNFSESELTEPELPMRWEDIDKLEGYYTDSFCGINYLKPGEQAHSENKNTWPTKEIAEASIALAQLLQLRQRWVGDWVPYETHCNHCIGVEVKENRYLKIVTHNLSYSYRVLSFPTPEMVNRFKLTFYGLLETAKPLL